MTCSELQPMTSPLLVFRALHFLNPRIWNWLQPGYWRSLSRPQILESLVPGGREWPRHLDFHEDPRRAHVGGEGTEPLRMQLWQVGLQVAVMGPCCQLGWWEWKSGGRREQVGRGRWGDSASPLAAMEAELQPELHQEGRPWSHTGKHCLKTAFLLACWGRSWVKEAALLKVTGPSRSCFHA